mmetsp:Transcript_26181/g.75089  ORF Transcript_26181/g.75089 Transcript_26181/m.75089 type:complete len:116 (+) Transcript_26181:652-999(+)
MDPVCCFPRGAWRSTGIFRSSSWVPVSTMRPSSKTRIWSQSFTVVRRCAMINAVAPVFLMRASSAACTIFSLAGSSAEVASSRMRICGCRIMARAIATRCRCPPDKVRPLPPTIV